MSYYYKESNTENKHRKEDRQGVISRREENKTRESGEGEEGEGGKGSGDMEALNFDQT